MQDVTGKVAFITGGASGMGLAMARSFSAAGMKVVIADIEDSALEAVADFADLVLEPLERGKRALVNDDVVSQ